jgi:proteic killer suppression protein
MKQERQRECSRLTRNGSASQLAALDTAQEIADMDLPGYRLHPLKGGRDGRWSIAVNGNWRMTFEFRDGNAYVLDYEDYH